MGRIQEEPTQEESTSWRLPGYIWVPLAVGGVFGLAGFYQYLQESKVSPQEAQDAIYAEYGECFVNTPYALGRTAIEYTDDVAQVTPVDGSAEADVLVYKAWLGLAGKVLLEPDRATERLLVDRGCESQKSLEQIATGG